jgi:hypothetical protein
MATLLAMREIDASVVHGGHTPSFREVRYRQLIDECLRGNARPAAISEPPARTRPIVFEPIAF